MVRKLTILLSCILLVWCIGLAVELVVHRELARKDGLAGQTSKERPNWTAILIKNSEILEHDLEECVGRCDRTIEAAKDAGESAVAGVALMQRACANMDLLGIQYSGRDFQAALQMFPDDAEDELRLLFTQALCVHERYSAPRHTHLVPSALKFELTRVSDAVDPAVRLRAFCDLLSYQTLDAPIQAQVFKTAEELVPASKRDDLKIRLEFLRMKDGLRDGSVDAGIPLMKKADLMVQQSGFAQLSRKLKIEMLVFAAEMQSRYGDAQTSVAFLRKALSEATDLQNKTLIALCDVEIASVAMDTADETTTDTQESLHERQAEAESIIPAINDTNVLHRLLTQLSDRRSSVKFQSDLARAVATHIDDLATEARMSANALSLRLANRDSIVLAKQAKQLTAEQLRADTESKRSLLVTQIGLAVFCCLAVILWRERRRLRQANERLKAEIIRNDQQQLEKERIELRLAQTERLESLGALAGGIAHDFNNLLVGVIGNADLLMHIEPTCPMVKDCVEGIMRSAETAADLSRKMLAYAGKVVPRKKIVDLNDLIIRMLPLLRAGLGGRHTIRFFPADECLSTEADSGQLEQILLNLVSNASQAITGNQGDITIRTGIVTLDAVPVDMSTFGNRTQGGRFVWFEVSDTGSGIPESHLARVFEPFFTTKEKSSGHGFGLAVVYGHVNRHDGLIQLQSSPGNGTRLRILLPHSAEDVLNDAPPTDSSLFAASDTFRVVAVDDQVEVLDVIERILTASGARVQTFSKAADALDFLVGNSDIDCILLDMIMPVIDGSAMLQELMYRGNSIPVVVMSGYSAASLGSIPKSPEVRAFIQKPFKPAELLTTVRSVISSRRRAGELLLSDVQNSCPSTVQLCQAES